MYYLRTAKSIKKIKIVLILLIFSKNMQAQENYDSYVNQVFFNVFSPAPHSSIQKFLRDFVPSLLPPRKNSNNQWTVYSSMDVVPVTIIHSIIFYRHPFIDASIKKGEFKVYTVFFNDSSFLNKTSIADIKVILEFEKLEDATILFEKIRGDLMPWCQEQTYYRDEFRMFYDTYCNDHISNVPSGIRVQLDAKRNNDNLYQLSINLG